MRVIANIFWFIFTGLASGVVYVLLGIIACATLIGIPLGIQCFKFAKISFCPFGKKIETDFHKHPVLNVFWLIFGGLVESITFAILGVVACATIILIPIGIQEFKLAKLAFAPFGAKVTTPRERRKRR